MDGDVLAAASVDARLPLGRRVVDSTDGASEITEVTVRPASKT